MVIGFSVSHLTTRSSDKRNLVDDGLPMFNSWPKETSRQPAVKLIMIRRALPTTKRCSIKVGSRGALKHVIRFDPLARVARGNERRDACPAGRPCIYTPSLLRGNFTVLSNFCLFPGGTAIDNSPGLHLSTSRTNIFLALICRTPLFESPILNRLHSTTYSITDACCFP